MSDEEIVIVILSGRTEIFSELVSRYQAKVYRTVCGMLGSSADVEDVTQDVLVKVYRHLSSFRRQSLFSTWLFRITLNTCKTYLTRQKLKKFVSLEWLESVSHSALEHSTDLSKDQEQKERIGMFYKALDQLGRFSREILVLREVHEMEYKVIAEVLGISIGTVKSRLFRAKSDLKIALLKIGFHHE